MPHKHKRRNHDARTFDLPPSMVAKPLPVRDAEKTKSKAKKAAGSGPKDQKKSHMTYAKDALEDDTPKAFRRLMTMHTAVTTGGSRPRDGPLETEEREQSSKRRGGGEESNSRKRKRDPTDTSNDGPASRVGASTSKPKRQTAAASQPAVEEQTKSAPIPKILPGERLSDFAARVDRELPLSAMKKSSNPGAGSSGLSKIREERQTKHERRLLRLQRQWREDDARIREREEAEREEREAEMEEELDLWKQWEAEAGRTTKRAAGQGTSGPTQRTGSKNKKKKKAKGSGNNDADLDDDSIDPWAKLKSRDRMNKPVNPFEVAQAPPQLTKPREIFKVRGGAKIDVANVPAAAGSLRRREELAGERRSIVEEYRRLMAQKRQ